MPPMRLRLTALSLAIVLLGTSAAARDPAPPPSPNPSPTPGISEEFADLRKEILSLGHKLDAMKPPGEIPGWASENHRWLDRRLERALVLLEKLAARVETPVPRLDEPLTLFTLSLCTFVLGFLLGRSLRARRSTRDSRFGL